MKKKLMIAFVVALLLSAVFVVWASVNGLVILWITSPGNELSAGTINLPNGNKAMWRIGDRLFGAYTVASDRDISLEVMLNGSRRNVAFGYATPGEFQINVIELRSSGEFEVGHHTIP